MPQAGPGWPLTKGVGGSQADVQRLESSSPGSIQNVDTHVLEDHAALVKCNAHRCTARICGSAQNLASFDLETVAGVLQGFKLMNSASRHSGHVTVTWKDAMGAAIWSQWIQLKTNKPTELEKRFAPGRYSIEIKQGDKDLASRRFTVRQETEKPSPLEIRLR